VSAAAAVFPFPDVPGWGKSRYGAAEDGKPDDEPLWNCHELRWRVGSIRKDLVVDIIHSAWGKRRYAPVDIVKEAECSRVTVRYIRMLLDELVEAGYLEADPDRRNWYMPLYENFKTAKILAEEIKHPNYRRKGPNHAEEQHGDGPIEYEAKREATNDRPMEEEADRGSQTPVGTRGSNGDGFLGFGGVSLIRAPGIEADQGIHQVSSHPDDGDDRGSIYQDDLPVSRGFSSLDASGGDIGGIGAGEHECPTCEGRGHVSASVPDWRSDSGVGDSSSGSIQEFTRGSEVIRGSRSEVGFTSTEVHFPQTEIDFPENLTYRHRINELHAAKTLRHREEERAEGEATSIPGPPARLTPPEVSLFSYLNGLKWDVMGTWKGLGLDPGNAGDVGLIRKVVGMLVSGFCAYDSGIKHTQPRGPGIAEHWVSDYLRSRSREVIAGNWAASRLPASAENPERLTLSFYREHCEQCRARGEEPVSYETWKAGLDAEAGGES